MALHDDLLAVARALVPDVGPPPTNEAQLRRGVSTAYYALFYLIIEEATTRLIADPTLRPLIARSFEHRQMSNVCEEYSQATGPAGGPWLTRSGGVAPVELRNFGLAFKNLQTFRHEADYDVARPLIYADAVLRIMEAELAFIDRQAIRADPAAGTFLTKVFLKCVQKRS